MSQRPLSETQSVLEEGQTNWQHLARVLKRFELFLKISNLLLFNVELD